MSSFNFDENLSIDENLVAFFKHMKESDEEFGKHLAEKLPQAVDSSFSRQVFNRGVEAMLDAAKSPSSEDL